MISLLLYLFQVILGPAEARRRNGRVHSFVKMKKNELIDECHYRGLPAGDLLKPELEKNLKEHLYRTQRVPALSFNSQKTPMEHNNLEMYEVAERFLEVKETLLTYKSKLRGLDYRLSAIVMYKHMEGESRYCVQELPYTLAQLCHLLYIQDRERTPKIILRLHNTAFKHAMCHANKS